MNERGLPSIHDREPLLRFIRAHLDAEGRVDPALRLPDEPEPAPDRLSFAPGALDGITGHHGGSDGQDERPAQVAELIVRAAAEPTGPRLRELYDAVNTEDVLAVVDPIIEALAARQPSTVAVAEVGTWLASTSPDRGPVKLGIALLGVTGAPDGSVLHDLGTHDEFTLFAVVAFVNSRSDPEPDLFALARRVDGWGRIHCVEHLRRTTDPQIAAWILRKGFRNNVMDEYLAHIAATTGDLAGALDTPDPDRELLTAAADIIAALITGGPAEDIDDYPAAPQALSRWLDHMDRHAETLADLLTIDSIRTFCDRDDWDARLTGSAWTADGRDATRRHATTLLEHPRWPSMVRVALDSAESREFWDAERCARVLGIDATGHLLARIEADPLDGPWFQAWRGVDADGARVLVERAAALLDLDRVATGPSQAIGMGPGFEIHQALGWTLQGIRDHPGLGADLITAALQSPSIQNRNSALNALEAWGLDHWDDEHVQAMRALAAADPDGHVRERAGELLSTR